MLPVLFTDFIIQAEYGVEASVGEMGQPLSEQQTDKEEMEARPCRTDDVGPSGDQSRGRDDDPQTCSTFIQSAV